MWYDYYTSIFNVVHDSSSSALHADLCMDHCTFEGNMLVHPYEIDEIIKGLPGNKSSGLKFGLKGAAVAEATRARWHTCSLLFNFAQYLCPMVIK